MNKRMKNGGKLKKRWIKKEIKREVLHPFFSSQKIPSLEALFRRGVEPRSALCVFPTAYQSRRSSSQLAYSRTARDYHHRFPGKSFSPPPDLNHHGIDIATAENHRSQSGKIRSQFLHYQSEKLPKENRFSPHHGLRHTRPTTPKGGAAKCSGTKSSQTSQLWLWNVTCAHSLSG